MIEVAIQAVEAVFDWKEYQAENFGAGSCMIEKQAQGI